MSRHTKKGPLVVGNHGTYRFMRGMVAQSLLERGLTMAEAYAVSEEIRDRVRGRERITTADLEQLIAEGLATRLGMTLDLPQQPDPPPPRRG